MQRTENKENQSPIKSQKITLRSIHHLACTGGTLISKCIASMPDVALISEVNPMNRFGQDFCPSNPCLSLEHCYRKFTEGERIIYLRNK